MYPLPFCYGIPQPTPTMMSSVGEMIEAVILMSSSSSSRWVATSYSTPFRVKAAT